MATSSYNLGLAQLPTELPLILATVVFLTALYNNSKYLLDKLFPSNFQKLTSKEKSNWQLHFVSFVVSITLVTLAIPILVDNEFKVDPFNHWTAYSSRVMGFVTGYFVWDIIICIINEGQNFQFILHGVICFLAYLYTLKPIMHYFAAAVLLYECSTPFLNINWFLIKMGFNGSKIQLLNGILLISTFFTFRVLIGIYFTIYLIGSLITNVESLGLFTVIFTVILNLTSTSLNLFWFTKLIQVLVKRVSSKPKSQ